jgi:dienelactone hydrolase
MSVERITYRAGSVEAIGALVRGSGAPADAPLVLVSPNWLGVTDAAITQAREIAEGRYHVFVADMFGGGKTASGPQDAAPLADALRSDWAERRARIKAGFDTMLATAKAQGLGDGRRTAAMGFCFGGGNALELARAGTTASAIVSLHGDLVTQGPAAPAGVSAKFLVAHGAADPVAPKQHRDSFEAEMNAAGANWTMLCFGHVLHSFAEAGTTVPGVAQYDPRAARLSFSLIHTFLEDAWAE